MGLVFDSGQDIGSYLSGVKNPCWREANSVKQKTHKANIRAGASRFRCLPYVYVIGVTKSGTTDLFHALQQHPQIVSPLHKELQYWHRSRLRGTLFLSNPNLLSR